MVMHFPTSVYSVLFFLFVYPMALSCVQTLMHVYTTPLTLQPGHET